MSLNERLRHARKAKGLTLEKLATKTGLNLSSISRLERESRDPKASSLGKLANVLEVSVGFLMGTEDQQLEFQVALRRQSLQQFLAVNPMSEEQRKHFEQLCFLDSGPNSVRSWQDLVQNAAFLLAQRALE
jgi:transcriptional regulator with XRE-family HTH domain